MSKADLGRIKKEKTIKNFIVYFSDIECSMFLIVAKDGNAVAYSRAFPYSDLSRRQQGKLARNLFNNVVNEIREKGSLDCFES